MRIRKSIGAAGLALIVALGLSIAVQAASVTVSGVTLTYPDYPLSGPALLSCEPWQDSRVNTVSLTGIPAGSNVVVTFGWSNPYVGSLNTLSPLHYYNVQGGSIEAPVQYPMDTSSWPVWNQTTNERAIAVAVFVRITLTNGTVIKLNSKNWWIRCLPPPPPSEGCTPGYWKQDQHFDSWVPTGYATTDDFEAIFGVNATFDPHSLLDALERNGGGENALARHAVAALLNAAHPDIDYEFTVAEVIAGVQSAYATGTFEPFKDELDQANNAGCDLN